MLALGELVTEAAIGCTGIGDLFKLAVIPLLKEEFEAVLKAGLVPEVPNAEIPVEAAGVLITTVETFVLGRTGLRLQLLLRIGVSLWFLARIGEEDSFQLMPGLLKFELRTSFSFWLLLFKLGPLGTLMSSSEVLFDTKRTFDDY